jgi:hypothetical protein
MRARIASRCGAILGRSQISVTSQCTMRSARLAHEPCRVREKATTARRAISVRRRKMQADIARADAPEDRVGQRMQSGIGIGMAFEPMHRARIRRRTARHDRRPRSGAHRSRSRCEIRRPASNRSAVAKSSGVVIFILTSSPATAAIFKPASSASAMSSVRRASAMRRCAFRIASKRKPCGVCARISPSRGTVVQTPFVSRFSVSATAGAGSRQSASPSKRGTSRARSGHAETKRPRGIVNQNVDRACLRGERLQPVAHRFLPRRRRRPAAGNGRRRPSPAA